MPRTKLSFNVSEPFKVICVDITGSLPVAEGCSYILGIVYIFQICITYSIEDYDSKNSDKLNINLVDSLKTKIMCMMKKAKTKSDGY